MRRMRHPFWLITNIETGETVQIGNLSQFANIMNLPINKIRSEIFKKNESIIGNYKIIGATANDLDGVIKKLTNNSIDLPKFVRKIKQYPQRSQSTRYYNSYSSFIHLVGRQCFN